MLWTQKLPHHHGARLTLPAPLSISLCPALSRCHLLQVSLSTLPPLQRSGHRSCPTIMAPASHSLHPSLSLSLQLCLAATYCKFPCPHCRPYSALDTEAAPPSWQPPHTPCTPLYLSLQLCLAATYCKFPCPHCRPYSALDTEAAPPSWQPPHTPCTPLYLSVSSSVSLPLTASFPVHIAALTALWTQKLPHHHGSRLTLPAPLSISLTHSLSPALSRCHLLHVSLSTLPPLQRSGHRSCPTIMAAASHLLYLFLTPCDSSLVQCSHCPQGVHILGAEGKKHTGQVWIEHVLSIDQRNLFVLSGEYNFCHK